jgi:hypothetical protein
MALHTSSNAATAGSAFAERHFQQLSINTKTSRDGIVPEEPAITWTLFTEMNMKSDRIKSWPKNERPRERLLANGAEALTDAELLAVILRVGQGTFKEGVAGLNATAFAKLFNH